MERRVKPEFLDELPGDDPRAIASRKDLQRINTWMGHPGILASALRLACNTKAPQRILELGAGDGSLLLNVAHRLAGEWENTSVALLDRQMLVPKEISTAFERLGWHAESIETDLFQWLREPAAGMSDVIFGNLVLHHFLEAQLAELLLEASRRTRVFLALEPRRSSWALAFSRLVWLIGCNEVTRHDAPVSVRAGFSGRELSRLWPPGKNWVLEEHAAGPFSHLFVARRVETASARGAACRR